MPFYRSVYPVEVIRGPSLYPCWSSSLEKEIPSFDRRLNPHRSHQALPQFRHASEPPTIFFYREPAVHVVRHPALLRHSCRPKRTLSFTSSFLDDFMVQFFLDKSQEVQRQRLLKHRLHQELKSKIAKGRNEKLKDGVHELLEEGHTQHYSTFDSEHGWKITKDAMNASQLDDRERKSNLAQNVMSPSKHDVPYEDVSVEDVDEDDESERSEIVVLEKQPLKKKSVASKLNDAKVTSDAIDQVVARERALWSRELELLAILGYKNQDSLMPLLQKHVGHPGNPDRSGLKKIIQELLVSSASTSA